MSNLNPLEKLHKRIEQESKFSEAQIEEFKELVSEYYYQITYGKEAVKLNSIGVEDFNNIIEANFHPLGESKALHGQNSEGKTSLLKAIQFNLLGLPEDKGQYGMTNLIRRNGNILTTQAAWIIDDQMVPLRREMVARGRGGELKRHNEPTLGESNGDFPQDRHHQPSEVFDKFGLLPLINRGYNSYEIMSLFFLMSRDFLNFLNDSNSSEIIDMLFGVYLTNVLNAVERKRDSEVEITNAMAKAPVKVEEAETELVRKREALHSLEEQRSSLRSKLASKEENLESIKGADDVESLVNDLRTKRSRYKSELADLKMDLSEATSELAKTERLIERFEDTELIDDIGGIGDELKELMTVPDRCPVCTNSVDGEDKKKMLKDADCPLCHKDVPKDRMRIEREYQPEDSLVQQRQEQEDELEEHLREKAKLESTIRELKQDIEDMQDNIADIDDKIANSDLTQILNQQERLESEISDIRNEAVDVEVQIERVENEIRVLEYNKKGYKHLESLLHTRKDRKEALERLEGIIKAVRDEERSKLKTQLEDEMKSVLNKFTSGIFSGAHSVTFEEGDTYHFTVASQDRHFRSSQAEPEAAEATLHALLFHAAVLKRLSEIDGSLPIRFLIIDSPFANEMSSSNRNDVSKLLADLPEYLDDYQIIVAMADPEFGEKSLLDSSLLELEEFEARISSTNEQETQDAQLVSDDETDDRGVA